MALLGWLFIGWLFRSYLPAEQIDSYIAGLIILAAAPCTAMVFVWSNLPDLHGTQACGSQVCPMQPLANSRSAFVCASCRSAAVLACSRAAFAERLAANVRMARPSFPLFERSRH